MAFGHDWRANVPTLRNDDGLFGGVHPYRLLGRGRAMCIDYPVGARASERRAGRTQRFVGRLAALRWPERELVFDDGEHAPLLQR